jgi:hypothetical protein
MLSQGSWTCMHKVTVAGFILSSDLWQTQNFVNMMYARSWQWFRVHIKLTVFFLPLCPGGHLDLHFVCLSYSLLAFAFYCYACQVVREQDLYWPFLEAWAITHCLLPKSLLLPLCLMFSCPGPVCQFLCMFIIVNHSVALLTTYLQNIFIQFSALNIFTCYNFC